MKRILFAAAALALAGAAALPQAALAQVDVALVIRNAPPPPRVERIPAPRHGYAWVPGYWRWEGRRHVWESGRWEPVRPGQVFQPAQWRQEGDGWHFIAGGWVPAYATMAPPPPRYEVVPAPRPGFIWAPGYWDWQRDRHVWIGGNWIAERPGYRYEHHNWVQRDGHWVAEGGRWSRADRDHDGIPNGRDHDRDGDGRPNRYDRHPDNPNRN